MNSRRKFRAYHTEEKRMFQVETLGEWAITETIGKNDFKGYSLYQKDGWPKIEIMQCTGIKDSKGKDVYEGDIIRDNEFVGHQYYKITWDRDALTYKATNIKYGGISSLGKFAKIYDFEVVGNIYENNQINQ